MNQLFSSVSQPRGCFDCDRQADMAAQWTRAFSTEAVAPLKPAWTLGGFLAGGSWEASTSSRVWNYKGPRSFQGNLDSPQCFRRVSSLPGQHEGLICRGQQGLESRVRQDLQPVSALFQRLVTALTIGNHPFPLKRKNKTKLQFPHVLQFALTGCILITQLQWPFN